MLVGELNEDVFEAGSERTNFGDGNAVLHELFAEIAEIETVFDERVDGLPENGCAAYSGEATRKSKSARDFRGGNFNAQRAGGLHVREFAKRIGRAVGDELAVINVGDVTAALGFVHVVSGDKKRDAMTRKLEEKIPELAARDGIDARGGLVEKEECGLMEHGAAESETLLPAARKLRGQAIQIGCEAVELDNFVDAALQARGLQAVDAAVELQVFRDGQVVVETEILRHVADVLADRFGIGADVEAFHEGGTAAEWQKAGEHLDDGGFSAAVGAEETEDFAFFNAEADVVDGGEVAEAAHEVLRGDGGVSGRLQRRGHGFSSPLSASHPQPYRQARGQRDHRCEFLCQ